MSIVAVVGLGYVGLPLAVEFGKKQHTIGFDLSTHKIESYKRHVDPTGEVSPAGLQAATQLIYTCDPAELSQARPHRGGSTHASGHRASTRFWPADRCQYDRRQIHEAGCYRHLRIDRLSGCH